MLIACNSHFTPAVECGSLTFAEEKTLTEEALDLRGQMKRKMGYAMTAPKKVYNMDKRMGGLGMIDLENTNVFRRAKLFIKE